MNILSYHVHTNFRYIDTPLIRSEIHITTMENVNGKRPSSAIVSSGDEEIPRIDFIYTGQDNADIPRNITHLRIDSSIKTIGEEAFKDCSQLVEVDLCENVEVIEKGAFQKCKLTQIYTHTIVLQSCKGECFLVV